MLNRKLLIVWPLAFLFSWLFFNHSAGINLLLFDVPLLWAVWYFSKEKMHSPQVKLFYMGTLVSAIMVAWHNTDWSILMHNLSFGLLGGALAAPQLRTVFSSFVAAIFTSLMSIQQWWLTMANVRTSRKQRPLRRVFYVLGITIVPLLAVLLFGQLYAEASPWFSNAWQQFWQFLDRITFDFFAQINFQWLFTFGVGLWLCIFLLFSRTSEIAENLENNQPENLMRQRTKYRGQLLGLKREKHVALALFMALNALLLVQNGLDIAHVWVGFSWNGEYLKQFVHEGTYALIFSILLSGTFVLFFFRGNLNFWQNNRTLKLLAYIWIFQNMFLAASVAMRNLWYIQYFNLAYKRIGVFFFLVAVVYGLYTVFVKVAHKKTTFYLIRTNALAAYLIVLSIGFVNWDVVIARYNFAHAKAAYLHLNFLVDLNNAALPDLQKPAEYLAQVQQEQQDEYGRDNSAIAPEEYTKRINNRITNFKEDYATRHWLEWNYDDWQAFKNLNK